MSRPQGTPPRRPQGAARPQGTARPLVGVVGDVLLDRDVDGSVTRLSPDAPVPVVDVETVRQSPGGAGLAALLCAGRADVVLVAPVADDDGGAVLRARLAGLQLVPLGHEGGTRTKTRVRSSGQSLVRVDDGGPGTPRDVDPAVVAARLAACDVVLVSDYGGGVTHDETLRAVLADVARERPVVWDPHPRGGRPVPGCALVTPNRSEAVGAAEALGLDVTPDDVAALAAALREAWGAQAVAVTAGARGACVAQRGGGAGAVHVAAVPVSGGDPCGAGDRFAATVSECLARGRDVVGAVREAVAAAGAWVAAGGAEAFRRADGDEGDGTPPDPGVPASTDALERLGATLRTGGTLVATGGCFDLVHAGHVATLQAARALGDRLVVLVNSDASVRRLKGPDRPLVPAAERVRVLEALDAVDAAVVFDEDDPSAALDLLRPDVWAKGGDYAVEDLPEAEVVARHGGRTVVLPYLDGRSTTALVARARGTSPLDRALAPS
ncbi:bifunctional heptose 7-phosphate kinase/heptose 1-phosphate adenyltransferase [Xylanimonas oleitrophica]|uniref:Bifunctional heptose 7-phosphate kinase/heptose 1-phosphate adenyltransferase n=1 Tax=Xylanimonas oleitrophica TaxID=2607479 RepID=A0A2W5WME7_9MICO|nr:PfkB family carbohydrate kinase [Xylanimonas oleitrophica]PZR52182.1 bifunctional heptose 7-phosphate kinase/heptose 1-phosphate adenyltransferase [Xylanimonas oleitrophica]